MIRVHEHGAHLLYPQRAEHRRHFAAGAHTIREVTAPTRSSCGSGEQEISVDPERSPRLSRTLARAGLSRGGMVACRRTNAGAQAGAPTLPVVLLVSETLIPEDRIRGILRDFEGVTGADPMERATQLAGRLVAEQGAAVSAASVTLMRVR